MNDTTETLSAEWDILQLVNGSPNLVHLNGHHRTWALVTAPGRPDVLCDKPTVERLLLTRRLAFGHHSNLAITATGLQQLHQVSAA